MSFGEGLIKRYVRFTSTTIVEARGHMHARIKLLREMPDAKVLKTWRMDPDEELGTRIGRAKLKQCGKWLNYERTMWCAQPRGHEGPCKLA
jgi:hypothetical protein